GLEVGSIRRIQGLDTAYWGFLGVRTAVDIFQNIIFIPYFQYGVLVFWIRRIKLYSSVVFGKDLKNEAIMVVPNEDETTYTREVFSLEYEWQPPRKYCYFRINEMYFRNSSNGIQHCSCTMGATTTHDNLVHFCNAIMEVYGRKAPDVPFVANDVTYKKEYYVTDGIFLKWSVLIKFISNMRSNDHKGIMHKTTEAARKYVERTFGV
nr:protein ALP1-like [Tanacetum cinerariifolium]